MGIDLGKILLEKWVVVMTDPLAFLAVLGAGLFLGWLAARLIYNQRLTHHQELIANYRDVLEDKLPARALRPFPIKRSRKMSFGLVLLFGGIGVAFLGALIVSLDRSAPPIKTSKQPESSPPVSHPTAAVVPSPSPSPTPAQPPVATPATPAVRPVAQLGPIRTAWIMERLEMKYLGSISNRPPPGSNPIELRWAVVITAPPENTNVAEILYKLISARLDVVRLEVPDRKVMLDAPAFPEPGEPGITLHGDDILSKRLWDALRPCFLISATKKTLDLREWYGNRLSKDQQIVWIEIGRGSPWTGNSICLELGRVTVAPATMPATSP